MKLTIELDDQEAKALQDLSQQDNQEPQALLHLALQQYLSHRQTNFDQAVQHVLDKNKELYRRLAL